MIEVKHLTKQYGDHTAVDNLSFTIEKGQIYGFLGPNGAGKSTTMNIMTGCLAATEGEVKIGGFDIFEHPLEAKKLIGYLPEQPPLYLDRTPREYLKFVAGAKAVAKDKIEQEIERVMQQTQICDVADRLIKHLSKGYKQRVGIAQALIGNPEVIILDEPTVGLDPIQIIEIRDLIKSLGENHTVILSSHILSEVQAVCQTILIISKGKLVACDTPQKLEQMFAGTATVDVTAFASQMEIQRIISKIDYLTGYEITPVDGKKCKVKISADKDMGEEMCKDIFFAFSNAGKPIVQMNMVKASLEDIFIELTNGEYAVTAQEGQRNTAEEVPQNDSSI